MHVCILIQKVGCARPGANEKQRRKDVCNVWVLFQTGIISSKPSLCVFTNDIERWLLKLPAVDHKTQQRQKVRDLLQR